MIEDIDVELDEDYLDEEELELFLNAFIFHLSIIKNSKVSKKQKLIHMEAVKEINSQLPDNLRDDNLMDLMDNIFGKKNKKELSRNGIT